MRTFRCCSPPRLRLRLRLNYHYVQHQTLVPPARLSGGEACRRLHEPDAVCWIVYLRAEPAIAKWRAQYADTPPRCLYTLTGWGLLGCVFVCGQNQRLQSGRLDMQAHLHLRGVVSAVGNMLRAAKTCGASTTGSDSRGYEVQLGEIATPSTFILCPATPKIRKIRFPQTTLQSCECFLHDPTVKQNEPIERSSPSGVPPIHYSPLLSTRKESLRRGLMFFFYLLLVLMTDFRGHVNNISLSL